MKKITFIFLFSVCLVLNAKNLDPTIKIIQPTETILESSNGFTTSQNDYDLKHFIDANGMLHIEANTEFDKIAIYNVIGQLVLKKELASKNAEIDIKELKTGIYIANITFNGERKAFKLVKK